MKKTSCDIAVIGGGAAALAFSVMVKGRKVTLFEKAPRAGKKLLATGNGRCNLTGLGVSPADYNVPDFVRPVLDAFSPSAAVEFFRGIGLLTRVSSGRVYPYSECASSVLDVLIAASRENGAETVTGAEVTEVRPAGDGFALTVRMTDGEGSRTEKVGANNVVLATGSPATSGSDSLALFAALGHKVRPFVPSLVPLKTDRESVKGLGGVRVKCAATLAGRREEGEILFRDYGLSGILALDLSAAVARGEAAAGDSVVLDFMPELTESEVAEWVASRDGDVERVLRGAFHSRLAERIAWRAGLTLRDIPDAAAVARAVKHYTLTLEGTLDASQAQVMSGGLSTECFDAQLASRIVPGAYAVGEALDVDGLCGGCNLQWAWASAYAAAGALSRG